MPRLTSTTPLLAALLAGTACPAPETPVDTEGSSTGETTMAPDTGSTTVPPPDDTTTTSTSGGPESSSGADSSTGELVCEPGCGPDECCVSGLCFDAPDPVCNPGCDLFEACRCPEGADPCTCIGECVACGVEAPSYDPCLDMPCPDGSFCVIDDPADPGFAWCAQQGCGTDDCLCPLPAAGATATPACAAFDGDEGNGSCFLSCADGAECPEGMACRTLGDDSACVWEIVIVLPGYGDCADNPQATCQPFEDGCLSDAGGTGAACSLSGCANAGNCPPPPDTGDAPAACGDFGSGNTCYLDCAGGQTCPDGTVCTDMGGGASACLWTEDGFALDEDFEQGTFRPGWVVINVDGHTPATQVEFVSDAWVVTDAYETGTNFGAYSTSWYSPANQSDDWLVTPLVTLGPASVLSWRAWAPDQAYPDGYEVYVSTTGQTVGDFVDPPIFTIADEADPYAMHMVDLAMAGYMNEDVYFAFRNNSDDEFILVVDDLQVTQ